MTSIVSTKNNWDTNMRYLIPGMVQYARAYIIKCHTELTSHVKTLIEIFEQVLRLRLDDSAFALLTTIFTTFVFDNLKDHMKEVFTAIFTRIQFDKTQTASKQVPVAFSRGLLFFLSLFVNIYGYAELRKATDQVQPGILAMLLSSEAAKIRLVDGPRKRKEVCVAFCKVIIGAENMTPELFKAILEGLIIIADSAGHHTFLGMEVEDIGEDNKERMKYQQLYTATIEVRITQRQGRKRTREMRA